MLPCNSKIENQTRSKKQTKENMPEAKRGSQGPRVAWP